MRKLAVYVHGKGGNATESEHYKPLLPEYDIIPQRLILFRKSGIISKNQCLLYHFVFYTEV